jgi:hypothetical protein
MENGHLPQLFSRTQLYKGSSHDTAAPVDAPYHLEALRNETSEPTDKPAQSLSPPTLLDLTGHITRENDYYFAHGGYADIWKGIWLKDSEKRQVYI